MRFLGDFFGDFMEGVDLASYRRDLFIYLIPTFAGMSLLKGKLTCLFFIS